MLYKQGQMAETINNLESSITQLKESREKGMRDVVKEKERLEEEVKKAMHKVSLDRDIRKIIWLR